MIDKEQDNIKKTVSKKSWLYESSYLNMYLSDTE